MELQGGKVLREESMITEWDVQMPSSITDMYMPVSCMMDSTTKKLYLAAQCLDESKVVVVCATGEGIEEVRAEALIMDKLSLTCIPRKIDLLEDKGRLFLLREFIPGESLCGVVKRKGKLEENEVRELMLDICVLLRELYEQGMSLESRTIIPESIYLTPEGEMKLLVLEGIKKNNSEGKSYNSRRWRDNRKAVGKLIAFLLFSGNVKQAKKSEPFYRITRRCISSSRLFSYRNVDKLFSAVKLSAPKIGRNRKKAVRRRNIG